MKAKEVGSYVKVLADIASRGGRVPPLYLYAIYLLPGFVYSILETGKINIFPFLLVSVSILPMMAATNLFDDYFDYRKEIDRRNSPNTIYRKHPVFFFGVSERYLIVWAAITSIIYLGFLMLLSSLYGKVVLILGLMGWVLGYSYTGWPVGYKYRGLGEIGVFLSSVLVGSLVVSVLGGTLDLKTLLFFSPFSLLMILILFAGNVRDKDFDYKVGLKTLAVRLGLKGSKIFVSTVFITFYLLLGISFVVGVYPSISMITFVTVPSSYVASFRWYAREERYYENYLGKHILMVLGLLLFLIALQILFNN